MVVSKDRPGFIVNRILTSILFSAVRLHEEGVATKEDIDTAVTQGLGLPMGPFELLDLIGLDTIVFGSKSLFEELNESQYFCPITIRRLVAAGLLGRKVGQGVLRLLNVKLGDVSLFFRVVLATGEEKRNTFQWRRDKMKTSKRKIVGIVIAILIIGVSVAGVAEAAKINLRLQSHLPPDQMHRVFGQIREKCGRTVRW